MQPVDRRRRFAVLNAGTMRGDTDVWSDFTGTHMPMPAGIRYFGPSLGLHGDGQPQNRNPAFQAVSKTASVPIGVEPMRFNDTKGRFIRLI